MAYQVIARRWRPQSFDEVVYQDHISKTLQRSIENGRISHAYIFAGPRGVGKTTSARILAKSLNCINGPTPNPCGVCDNCIEIKEGRSFDVIEIDGASNNSVDDVRDLREKVTFAPVKGKYKVYIIDEVHMLSTSAFNALLKTLEEREAARGGELGSYSAILPTAAISAGRLLMAFDRLIFHGRLPSLEIPRCREP